MQSPTDRLEALKRELAQIEIELREAERDHSLRLGLFGVRDSGKSSLLAAWYLFRTSGDLRIDIRFDEASLTYLDVISKSILTEGSTATPMLEPEIIRFELWVDGDMWQVETRDFTGRYVELISDPAIRKMARPAREFLDRCDVILCCYYWRDFSLDILNALEVVFSHYQFRFLLAVTRMDELGTLPRSESDASMLFQAAQEENKTLGELLFRIKTLSSNTGRVTVIPVSPLGADFSSPDNLPEGKDFPLTRHDLTPCNIYKPLLHAIEAKKNIELRLRERHAELTEEAKRVKQHLSDARQHESEKKQKELDAARQQFEEARDSVQSEEASCDNSELPSWNRYVAIVKRVREIAKKHGDETLADLAAQFPKWANEIKKSHLRRMQLAALETHLKEIEVEVANGLGAGLVDWLASPVAKWVLELSSVEEQSKLLGDSRMPKVCREIARQIRRRQIMNWVIILAFVGFGAIGICVYFATTWSHSSL